MRSGGSGGGGWCRRGAIRCRRELFSFGVIDVDGDGIGDDEAEFFKEEGFAGRAGVRVTKVLLMFRLGG